MPLGYKYGHYTLRPTNTGQYVFQRLRFYPSEPVVGITISWEEVLEIYHLVNRVVRIGPSAEQLTENKKEDKHE
jgi:hypothetical protein